MAIYGEQQVVGRVIGDVVDVFIPSVLMNAYFGNKRITNGSVIMSTSIAIDPPWVTISGHHYELYTMVMTDPDAPNPSEPSMREWVHWIVTNIPGGTYASEGTEVLPYVAPRPTVGIHRYIFVLFKQRLPLGHLDPPTSRANFNTRVFARSLDLGLAVATVYFNSQKEPASRRGR